MEGIAQIEQAIESKRKEMYRASERYGLTSVTVLKISKELDALLNRFYEKRGLKR
ncbi:Spo0E family sporulation regulatory protein-aspartic acid phosphatase [Paenibacillus gansuensis]|uniref:Spo0E family sporulation regulatory protein-aspartic acid phosphatase n=1 Tax=Paenibacillus gansuensis TaxID=306542 RepID=A0ABW5PGS0_9BACL